MPADVLTRENTSTRNYEGVSVAALAAERGFIAQIPHAARPKRYGLFSRMLRRISNTRPPF